MNVIVRVFELRRTAVRWLIERIAPAPSRRPPRRPRVIDWVSRDGLAECAGIACAFLGSFIVRRATGNSIAAAYGAAWGESIGYATVIVTRDFLTASRAVRGAAETFSARRAGGVVSGLLAEFGPAALLDSFVTRPLAMGLGVRLLGLKLGVVAGKVAADTLFYIPVIFMYERRTRSAGG
jgi:hypothetical protein